MKQLQRRWKQGHYIEANSKQAQTWLTYQDHALYSTLIGDAGVENIEELVSYMQDHILW